MKRTLIGVAGVLAAAWFSGTSTAEAQFVVGVVTAAQGAAASTAPEAEDEFVDEYATVTADVSDPFERVNRTIFKFNNSVYSHVLRPVARGYERVVPGVARRGLRSFFHNLYFPVRFISCTLQGKFDRAAAETGKFALNTTVGLAGFIRFSDRYPKLRVPEEDFGQTLGAWGFGPGPFLILPVLGPSSVRDGVGRIGDYFATPTHWDFLDHYDAWVETTLQVSDTVSNLPYLLARHDSLYRSAVDPYTSFRNAYLQYRAGEVKR